MLISNERNKRPSLPAFSLFLTLFTIRTQYSVFLHSSISTHAGQDMVASAPTVIIIETIIAKPSKAVKKHVPPTHRRIVPKFLENVLMRMGIALASVPGKLPDSEQNTPF